MKKFSLVILFIFLLAGGLLFYNGFNRPVKINLAKLSKDHSQFVVGLQSGKTPINSLICDDMGNCERADPGKPNTSEPLWELLAVSGQPELYKGKGSDPARFKKLLDEILASEFAYSSQMNWVIYKLYKQTRIPEVFNLFYSNLVHQAIEA